MERRIQVPPGGSVLRLVPVTDAGVASVTVRRDVTRHVELKVTPVCGPASRRTVSEAAATGGAATIPASVAANRASSGRWSECAKWRAVMAVAPVWLGSRQCEPGPHRCQDDEDPVTIR